MTPEISLRTQLVALVLACAWLVWIIYLVLKESLALRSSLGWVLIGLLGVGLSIYPKALVWFARATGIGLAANALFLFGFIAVLALLFGHTLVITKLLGNVRRLAQRIALYESEDRQHALPPEEPTERGEEEEALPEGGRDAGADVEDPPG